MMNTLKQIRLFCVVVMCLFTIFIVPSTEIYSQSIKGINVSETSTLVVVKNTTSEYKYLIQEDGVFLEDNTIPMK